MVRTACTSRVDQVARDRREDRVAGRGDVVVDRVAVRVVGDRAVLLQRADADHVRQRRRVVRVRPRRLRRLRPVADGSDDHRALRVRVVDRRLLERRVRVDPRVERVAHPAEAEVDDARAVIDGPVDCVDLGLQRHRAVGLHDLRDEQLRVERDSGDAVAVERARGDLAGHERPVTLGVAPRRAAGEALRQQDASDELRMAAVDSRVDHRDLHRSELRLRRPEIPGLVLLQVPLLRRERLGVVEREGRRRHYERSGERGCGRSQQHAGCENPGTRP